MNKFSQGWESSGMYRLVLILVVVIASVSLASRYVYAGERLSLDLLFPILVSAADKTEGTAPLLASKIHDIHREFEKLVAALEKLPGDVPTEYEEVFAEYGRQLNEVSANASATSSLQIAQELFDDLQVKNWFITSGFGFTPRRKILVSLQVTTINRAGAMINGYQVTCNPRRFAGTQRPLFPFSKLTSPAQQFVPPGIYSLEISRGGQIISTMDVRVGLSGTEVEDVQVEVQEAISR